MFQEIPFPFSIPIACQGRPSITGISTYSLMLVLAFLSASYLVPRELQRKRLNVEVSDWVILIAVIAAIVGAKIGFIFEVWSQIWIVDQGFWDTFSHVFFNYRGMGVKYPERAIGLWETFFSGAGLVFYGGFVLAFVSIAYYLKKNKLDTWRYADSFMPALALGYSLGRLGCLISGDGCYGYGADVHIPFFTMVYDTPDIFRPFGIQRWNSPIQPSLGVNVWNTPFIESLASFLLFLFYMLKGRFMNFRPGFLTATFLIFNGVVRFCVEFMRLNDALIPVKQHPPVDIAARYTAEGLKNWYWYGITQSQVIAAGLILFGVSWLVIKKLYKKEINADQQA